jgi:hypothetical protein
MDRTACICISLAIGQPKRGASKKMTSTNPLSGLQGLISASETKLLNCIGHIEHFLPVQGLSGSAHLHFLKFDGNGNPMIPALAELMYQHAIDYCIAARERPTTLTATEATRYTKEARKLFVHPPATEEDPDQTGEAGELLLYLLIESMLGAPQVVAKMELKTNTNLEVNGSDGIHMAWNEQDQLVDIFFGESKIYQDLGSAMSAALKSIDGFHSADLCRHEFLMVTKQFKYANEKIRAAVSQLLTDGVPTSGVRINHACLIGFNWKDYEKIFEKPSSGRLAELQNCYLSDAQRILSICEKKLESFANKHVRLSVFFLPFKNVQEFRDAFNAALK